MIPPPDRRLPLQPGWMCYNRIQTMNKITDIRLSPLAGRWYPADPKKLADSVDGYIQSASTPELQGQVIALISPHAGHIYSGPVAGYGFAAIKDLQPDLVVILSPYHDYHPGAIITTAHQAYQTPLGVVPVDQDQLREIEEKLKGKTGVSFSRVRNDEEHAVEIQLPFFQRSLKKPFQLLPLMFRDQDPGLMKNLGGILADLMREVNTLLTASTDLSHFHPAAEARRMDQTIINQITALDPEGLYLAQDQGLGAACGLGALACVIWASRASGPVKAWQLEYAHSGDVTGDNSRVVGYTSAVITLG
jgi:AmmeMemoRadiSam system protein B